MLNWNKELNTKIFKAPSNKNIKYIIFVATDVYKMKIDNPKIWLVI